jgi:type I restriction enzyme M protein
MEETVRLCRMNLAVNGLSGNITFTNSFYGELHKLWGQFDFVTTIHKLNNRIREG